MQLGWRAGLWEWETGGRGDRDSREGWRCKGMEDEGREGVGKAGRGRERVEGDERGRESDAEGMGKGGERREKVQNEWKSESCCQCKLAVYDD